MSVALNPSKVRGATLLPTLRSPDRGPQHRTLATDARHCAPAAPRLLRGQGQGGQDVRVSDGATFLLPFGLRRAVVRASLSEPMPCHSGRYRELQPRS